MAGFLVPAFVLYASSVLIPLMLAVVMSVFQWTTGAPPTFVGLGNWRALPSYNGFHAMAVSAEIIVISVLMQVPLSTALGVYVGRRGAIRQVLGVIYILPLLISGAGVALNWALFFSPRLGALSPFVRQDWEGSRVLAPILVTAVFTWRVVPFFTLVMQSAYRTIPVSIHEAAQLDGASGLSHLWYIVIPQLRYGIAAILILSMTGALTAFDLYFIMTSGGPGLATTPLAVALYSEAFTANQLGYAAVLGVILAVLGLVFATVASRETGFGHMRSQRAGAA